jgi:hypothetical protein
MVWLVKRNTRFIYILNRGALECYNKSVKKYKFSIIFAWYLTVRYFSIIIEPLSLTGNTSVWNKKKSSIKLVQLPVPEVQQLYAAGNIPLAAGYLKAFALQNGFQDSFELEIPPRDAANYGGDAALLKWLTGENTALAGFTCYMWNIERNLFLARELKKINPGIKVVFGGPELDAGHWALAENAVDAFVIGEGERAFMDLLTDLTKGRPLKRVYRCAGYVDLSRVPNPYLEKILVPFKDEAIFFETMRGCPYSCKYCFYSKSYSGLRFFPGRYLPGLFALAREYGVPEIYIMDPSFNVTPELKQRLEALRDANTSAIPVHTEIRLEAVTPGIARLMGQAGFKSVEVGLQSVNEKSLAAIGRQWDRKKFTRGARLLAEQGIDVKTGVILGLPHDDIEGFERTLDFVRHLDLQDSMEIYPLSLLPGTRLRDEARELGIQYMDHPPYWTLANERMAEKDFKAAVEMIEQKLEIEFFPPIVPLFKNIHPDFVHFLDLRGNSFSQLPPPERLGHGLTVLVDEQMDKTKLEKQVKPLLEKNPFTLVQVVIDGDRAPSKQTIAFLSRVFSRPASYFDHIHRFKIDTQGRFSVRFFHLTGNLATAETYLYQPRFCDLVLRYTPGMLDKARDILEERPILLVDGPVEPELQEIYRDFEALCAFGGPHAGELVKKNLQINEVSVI